MEKKNLKTKLTAIFKRGSRSSRYAKKLFNKYIKMYTLINKANVLPSHFSVEKKTGPGNSSRPASRNSMTSD